MISPSEMAVPAELLVAQHQDAAHASHDHDRDVTERFQRRSERAGKGDRADIGIPVGGVRLAEAGDILALAGEGLRFAHAGDIFLQIGIHTADFLTRPAEGFARLVRRTRRWRSP